MSNTVGTGDEEARDHDATDPSSSHDLAAEEDDLVGVVRNLKRRKQQHVNLERVRHPHTRIFLEAGMRLLAKEFAQASKSEGDDNFPSFKNLRRKDLVAEAARVAPELTEARFRDRWEFVPDYVGDLIRYALRSSHWSPHFSLVDEYRPNVSSGDLAKLAREVAYADLALVLENPAAMQFQFVAAAFAGRDVETRDALASAYLMITRRWEDFYQHILNSHGLTLRPGLTVEAVTLILHAAMEGFSLRLLGDPGSATTIMDHEHRDSLLGTLAMAMVVACIDPGDGRSLEDVIASAISSRRDL